MTYCNAVNMLFSNRKIYETWPFSLAMFWMIVNYSGNADSQGITSTGEYRNPLGIWAIGLKNLSFFHHCSNPKSKNGILLVWFQGSRTLLPASLTQYNSDLECDLIPNSNISNNISNSNSNSNSFGIECNKSDTGYTSQYVIHKMLDASLNNTPMIIVDVGIVDVGKVCGNAISESWFLTVKYCNKEIIKDNHVINVNIPGNASFEAKGSCTCRRPEASLFHPNGTQYSRAVAQCNAFAEWDGCTDAECWFAPSNITISQKPEYADQKANFDCDFSEGFPENASVSYFIGSRSVARNEILKSKYNGEQYHCEVANNYTKSETTTNKTVVSPSKELEVYFPPENLTYSTNATNAEGKIHIKINASANVNFTFHANDANGSVIAIFRQMNQSGSDPIPSSQNNTENDEYNFQYSLEINDTDDYGFYIFNVSTTDPLDFVNITIEIVPYAILSKTTVPTTLPDDPKIIYIAVGCSVAVVLIIALVVFLIVYRRRKEKSATDKDIKEERENPLYGSAPGPSINAEYATVDKSKKKQGKEEKVNPIYQGTSAGADADTVEEAYAAIDIKKKKKKKEKNSEGSENSAFDPEATYAAVNKPKKKKNVEPPPDVVYSAVQKKKKNDQPADTDLHV